MKFIGFPSHFAWIYAISALLKGEILISQDIDFFSLNFFDADRENRVGNYCSR